MQVCVIKNTEPKNVSIPLTMTAGGIAGLGLRYFMPVYKPEIDTVMFNQSDAIKRDNFETAKKTFIDKAKNLFKKEPENEALKLFLERMEARTAQEAKIAKEKIKNAPQTVKENVDKLKNVMAAQIKASRHLTEANIKNAVKQARPVWGYLLPGLALGALGGYFYNVVGTIKED